MSRNNMVTILNQLDSALVEECAAYCAPSERNGMKKKYTRRLAIIVLAACLAVGLAVTGYATGFLQSLISRYWSGIHYVTPDDTLREERPDYAQWLDEQLETQAMMLSIGEKAVPTEECYQIPGLDGAGVTLLEYYYDGEKIALGCQFRDLQQVDFDFQAEDYANLPYQTVEANGYPSYRSMVTQAEALQTIEERLRSHGAVSFLASDAWLSDHVYANGADLGCCHTDPDENGYFLVDPMVAGIGQVELPERCRNQPEISVSLTYRVRTYAFRLEGDTIQYAKVGQADYPIQFTIANLAPASIPEKWSLAEPGTLTAGEALDISQNIQGTTITIRTSVPTVNTRELSTITLGEAPQLWEKLGRELVLERFPQIQGEWNSGERDISVSDQATGNLLLHFSCSADGWVGSLNYLDVQRDLNGKSLDGEGDWRIPHDLTPIVPDGMGLTAEEAAWETAQLLSNYSCFQFTPWNVQAEYDEQKQQGCYRITLQPEYQALPVYGQRTTTKAFYSMDGLFCCKGLMLLQETQRTAIQSPIPLERAIESVVNHIPELSSFDTVQCGSIRLGYLARTQEQEVVLSPAWVFECSQFQSDAPGFTDYFEIAVLAEDGRIWAPHNGGERWVDGAS